MRFGPDLTAKPALARVWFAYGLRMAGGRVFQIDPVPGEARSRAQPAASLTVEAPDHIRCTEGAAC